MHQECVVRKSRNLSWGGKTERVAGNWPTVQHAFAVKSNPLLTHTHTHSHTRKRTCSLSFSNTGFVFILLNTSTCVHILNATHTYNLTKDKHKPIPWHNTCSPIQDYYESCIAVGQLIVWRPEFKITGREHSNKKYMRSHTHTQTIASHRQTNY